MVEAADITAQLRADIKKRDWGRVHLEADRRPFLAALLPRTGRYMGEGMRRERGAIRVPVPFTATDA